MSCYHNYLIMKIEPEILRGFSVAILYLAYLVLWTLKRKKLMKTKGIDPEVLSKDDRPSQRFFASFVKLMTVTLILLLILHSVGIKNIPGFYYIFEFSDALTAIIGLVIGISGLSVCLVAQKTMGVQWRVGIDRGTKTKLVTNGIFQFCRNPTYLGLYLICIATLFIFPTMSFLLWAVSFALVLESQVRLEEEYLLEKHGEIYRNYCKKVKRYIPWLY